MLCTLSVTTPDETASKPMREDRIEAYGVRGADGEVKPAVSESPKVRMRGVTPTGDEITNMPRSS
jgi:hypothetical protein